MNLTPVYKSQSNEVQHLSIPNTKVLNDVWFRQVSVYMYNINNFSIPLLILLFVRNKESMQKKQPLKLFSSMVSTKHLIFDCEFSYLYYPG